MHSKPCSTVGLACPLSSWHHTCLFPADRWQLSSDPPRVSLRRRAPLIAYVPEVTIELFLPFRDEWRHEEWVRMSGCGQQDETQN
jgi:hypothetical protein